MRIERLPTPNRHPGRDGHVARAIVIHTTAGTWEGTAAWFADPRSGVSSHYLVGLDARVAQFVDEADTARHAGAVVDPAVPLTHGPDPNLWTIGIELEDGGDPQRERPAEQLAAAAMLLRQVAFRHRIPLDRRHVLAHRELRADKTCPGSVDVDALIAAAAAAGPRVIGLLPVRNGERELPEWLESAGRWCDAVVALDDGSTDGTAALLEASPLVHAVLREPVRDGHAGWDDGRNRARLLAAALEFAPDWVVWVDADERIPPDDAAALRAFLLSPDAMDGFAYGLRHLRTWRDGHDPEAAVVYRVFAPRPGDTLPAERLHFAPVPTRIPAGACIPTTIRLQHVGAGDEAAVAARRAKYAEADPEGLWPTSFGGLDAPPQRYVPGWPPRPDGMAVLAPSGRPEAPAARDRRPAKLVTLLAARNAAEDLPGHLDALRGWCDAVVALDDGSTDGTAALLEADPLVEVLLRNPRRETYEGWDDAANRARLLDAAAELEPDWILVLDADERLPADDAAALRTFVDQEADPACAYGLRVFRMIDTLATYDTADLWVYRLFAWRPGLAFPAERLHYVPVPTAVPRERWHRTTFRIQHLSSLTAQRRAARFAKYEQADPDREHQADYERLLREPGALRPWEPRPEGLPALAVAGGPGLDTLDLHRLDLDAPVLSAIVISRNDEDRIERAVRSVVEQEVPVPFEVIVVVSGTDRTAQIVRERFGHLPHVRLVELDGVALPGRARNAGLALARGDYVSFPGSHTELPPGSLAARVQAHELGHAMVTGAMHNGTRTPAGWASYFLDHAMSLPGRPSAPLAGPPAHCSYARDLLLEIGGFPDVRAGEDTLVNRELWSRGHGAWRDARVALFHHSRCTTPRRLVRHHFQRGQAMGRIMLGDHAARGPLLNPRVLRRSLVGYLPDRLRRTADSVARWGDDEQRAVFVRVRPLVCAGALAAWAGMWAEILRPRRGKLRVLLGGPTSSA